MAFDSVPWMVAGGAVHSAEVGRSVAYYAAGGAEGVAEYNHLKVSALDTPGNQVKVSSGVCGIINDYGSEFGQMYVGRNIADILQTIAPTSGSSRSDMIVARIDDPQYGGTTPADVTVGPYIRLAVISNVGSTATSVPSDVAYPAIPLARIDIPASTATITNGMIKDLRQVATPRSKRDLTVVSPPADTQLTTTSTSGAKWPTSAGYNVVIPKWATRARIVANVLGVKVGNGGAGWIWVQMGTVDGQKVRYDTADSAGIQRQVFGAGDSLVIPAGLRGTTVNFSIRAYKTAGSGAAQPLADASSLVTYDIEFVEDPTVA